MGVEAGNSSQEQPAVPCAFPKWNKPDVDGTHDCTAKKIEAIRQVSGIREEARRGNTLF